MDSDVLIVGAGPTGLTLAIDLGRRGVRCTLVEQKEQPAFLPKMERVNARSMEIYRRMGLAEKIRAAGLRADCPMDVYIVLALTEPPLLHLPYPSVEEARAQTRANLPEQLPQPRGIAWRAAETRLHIKTGEFLDRWSKLRHVHGCGKFERCLRFLPQ